MFHQAKRCQIRLPRGNSPFVLKLFAKPVFGAHLHLANVLSVH